MRSSSADAYIIAVECVNQIWNCVNIVDVVIIFSVVNNIVIVVSTMNVVDVVVTIVIEGAVIL